MKRYRPLAFFGLSIVFGIITSVLVFSWLQNEKNRLMAAPLPTSANIQVVMANADIAWGTKLTPEMVMLQEVPPGVIPEGHFTTVEAVKDRVLLTNVKRNELLMESKLAPIGTSGGVAAVTDVNMRAMSVKVDDVIGSSRCHGDH
jgi:pilus assembly protein CpaB